MEPKPEETYSLLVGLIFIFNLILGTGVLTIPAVFAQAGYVVGIIVIISLCFMSYVQTTYVVEAMSNANFVKRMLTKSNYEENSTSHNTEHSALLSAIDDDDDEEQQVVVVDHQHHPQQQQTEDSCDPQQQQQRTVLICNETDQQQSIVGAVSSSKPSVNVLDVRREDDNDDEQQTNYCFDNPSYEHSDHDVLTVRRPSSLQEYDLENSSPVMAKVEKFAKKFDILDKFELGAMSELFLRPLFVKLFFFSIIVYLYGDLLIYNTVMAKSMRELSCTYHYKCNDTNPLDDQCWPHLSISRRNAYRVFLLLFISILTPLTYAGIKKTQSIQVITIILRWLAFATMVGITLKIFAQDKATGDPAMVNLVDIPKLFGICVYSFMCHHSLPSIVTPIRKKYNLHKVVPALFVVLASIYLLIALTGVFAFKNIADVYTLNFQKNSCSDGNDHDDNPAIVPGLNYFLPTFPIFTLFSSYTVIALTLISNIKVLARRWNQNVDSGLLSFFLPLVAILPPLVVAIFTEDVAAVVSYVGSYLGGLIQYVFPCLLVYYSRSYVQDNYLIPYLKERLSTWDFALVNINEVYSRLSPFASPFQSSIWLYVTGVWWIISLILVTVNHIIEYTKK